MKKLNQNLSEIFDVEPIELQEIKSNVPVVVEDNKDVIETDTEYARKNLRDLIEKGNDAMDKLLAVADQSEHPRAYEVAAGLIKNLADLNKDLLEIQKRKRDLQPKESAQNNLNIDKAVFVGSTAELVKMIKSNK